MAVTSDPNQDPRYAAVAAAMQNQIATARSNATLAKQRAQQDYAYQQALLGTQRGQDERALRGNLLARGVFRSGQAQQKGGELAANYLMRGGQLSQNLTNAQAAADLGLQQQISDINARDAAERGDALGRLQQRAFDEEERARQARLADAQLAAQRAQAQQAAALVGMPTYATGDEFARAANEYAAALARNEAAAAAAPSPSAFVPARRRSNPLPRPATTFNRDASLSPRPIQGRY